MPRINTDDGHSIDWLEHGDRHGRPVVLLAGFKAAAASWRFQVPALTGYRVVTLDLPGHGTAGAQPADVTMHHRGAYVHAALEDLDLHDAVLVGGSMGANTIWAYAAQFGTDRLGAIVTVDQTPKMLNDAEWPYGFYGYDKSNVDTYFATGVPPTGHGTPLWRRGLRLVRLLRAMSGGDRTLTPAELTLLDDHAKQDWRPTIGGVEVPVLFTAGAESEFWPPEHATAAAALAPHGSAAVIDKAGHATNIEQPKAFNAGLVRFLESL